MSRDYLAAIRERVVVFDGGMGATLEMFDLSTDDYGGLQGKCHEAPVLNRPDVIEGVHASMAQAGAQVVETDTFQASRLKLEEWGLAAHTLEINQKAVEIARRAVGEHRFVAGSIGPTGHLPASDDPTLGAIRFDSDTALTFRREILLPFLDQHLKDGAPKADVAPVMAFETGTNKWRRLQAWPSGCVRGCTIKPTPLYLGAGGKAGYTAPAAAGYEEYISDPAKPVPYISRPVPPGNYENGKAWREWLVTDQRDAATRPDVLVFTSDVLTAPLKISGRPIAPAPTS